MLMDGVCVYFIILRNISTANRPRAREKRNTNLVTHNNNLRFVPKVTYGFGILLLYYTIAYRDFKHHRYYSFIGQLLQHIDIAALLMPFRFFSRYCIIQRNNNIVIRHDDNKSTGLARSLTFLYSLIQVMSPLLSVYCSPKNHTSLRPMVLTT